MRSASKYSILLLIFLFPLTSAFSQKVQIQIASPRELKGRKAILLTREKGFAALVHSIKLNSDIFNLEINRDLVPDLYQLHVSQIKGSLLFFLEPGIKITLDTTDLSRSKIVNSKSTQEWKQFEQDIQQPSDKKIEQYTAGEKRARKEKNADSLNYWVDKQALEKEDLVKKSGEFITTHLDSYVSLYLLKINWYAFQGKGVFEQLNSSMAGHKTYTFLKERNKKLAKTEASESQHLKALNKVK
ncbi:hypothetical protein [Dyadobacter sp. LHD-138]|uniref:hypothetical protein n=1 Tax=Dyadobacter sp. LHD-138 TaxID=3071413 RepID=UPI0027E0D8D9|nr:hypothetical protein [Dyadobacter sp. LHD-138]MDQ6477636.1 hypothetical protein [Dyadobacter sp. LHD-138]